MLFVDLIYNLSVLVAISVLSGFVNQNIKPGDLAKQIMQGLLFGTAAIVGIANPVVLTEDIFFDGRSVAISISAMLFGPLSGIISAVMAIVLRAWIGGQGVIMGIVVSVTAFIIGSFFYYSHSRKSTHIAPHTFYSMGLLVHIVMVLLMLTLPESQRMKTMQSVGLSILVLYPLMTMLIGKILNNQIMNQKLIDDLKQSELNFRAVFFSISDAIITTDNSGVIKNANTEAEKLTGFNQSELVGKNIEEAIRLLNEKTGQPIVKQIFKTLREAKTIRLDPFLLQQKNGRTIPVTDSVAPILDKNNCVIGAVFVFRDRRHEIARNTILLRTAESYQNLFNNLGHAAYVQDRQGRFIDVNDGAVALYGYPKADFIGKTPDFLSAPGMNNLDELNDSIQAAFNGDVCVFEFWGKKSDGTIFPKEVHLFKSTYYNQEVIFALAHDISLRKKTEKDLEATQERYQTLFNASPIGIVLEDLDGIILDVNETICFDYGFARNELLGKFVGVLVKEDYKSQIEHNIEKIKKQKMFSTRVEGTTKTGVKKIFELIETLVELPDGRQGILSISKNITEQVMAEKTLIKSEARFKAIVSAVPDLFFRINNEGEIIDCFAHNSEQLNRPTSFFIGKNLREIEPRQMAEKSITVLKNAFTTGELQQFEYSLKINDALQWFDARIVKSGADEALAIIRNITDRKVAEIEIQHQKNFIETLFESIPNPLFYMNTQGVFLGINHAYKTLFNIEESDIVGKNIYDIENESNARRYKDSDKNIFDGIDAIQVLERTLSLPSGEELEVILTKSPFPDADGKIGGLIGMITDITARKKMEIELKTAKEQAEESDRLKTSFLNNMNHEIRTPLNAIIGFSDLLFDDYSQEEKRGFVSIINNNSEQLLKIIDDVLAISRLDVEHLQLEEQYIDVLGLFIDLLNSLKPLADQKELNLMLDEDAYSHPIQLFADKAKIRQVMTGLIENAIKYTLKGSINFGYSIHDDHIHFYVHDTGIGIPEQEKAKVFDRFFRGNEAQTKAFRGNGLGLSISKGLVEIMGGTIDFSSVHKKGSHFHFNLPLRQSLLQQETAPGKPLIHHEFSTLSLLIVDDEEDNRQLLLALLDKYFKTTEIAANGLLAYNIMQQMPYDVILMDLKMPVMDGFEATKTIMEQWPQTTIIAQTAYTQTDEIEKILKFGAKDFLTKPIEIAKLLNTLKKHLTEK